MPLKDITISGNIPRYKHMKAPNINNDDDNTFTPPALSSYSIALLNEQTTPKNNNVTSLHDMKIPQENRFGINLKNRLSVHFKEEQSHEPDFLKTNSSIEKGIIHSGAGRAASSNQNTNNNINVVSQTETSSILSGGNTNVNNLSGHNSFNMSAHNYSNHTHLTTDYQEYKASISNTTISELKNKEQDSLSHDIELSDSSNSNIKLNSQFFQKRRLRGLRRFGKTLGSPKRATKISENLPESFKEQNASDSKLLSLSNTPRTDLSVGTLDIQAELPYSELNESQEPKSTKKGDPEISPEGKTSESIFFKTLKKMKLESEELSMLKQKDIELRIRIDKEKKIHEIQEKQKQVEYDNLIRYRPLNKIKSGINSNAIKEEEIQVEPAVSSLVGNELHNPVGLIENSSVEKQQILSTHNSINKHEILSDEFPESRDDRGFKRPRAPASQTVSTRGDPEVIQSKKSNEKRKCITINGNAYEKLELIGRGGSSKVYKVKCSSNGKTLAIKKVLFDQFDESCVKGFKGEIDLLLRLKDQERVVKLLDHAIGDGSIYLVMECGDLDLAHVLQQRSSSAQVLDLDFIKYHSIELLKCVQAVHDADIVHSDLKPANFLFVKGMLKIIDFGIANAVPDHTVNIYRESQIGTPNYMAPEALVESSQALPGINLAHGNKASSLGVLQKNTWKVGKPSDVWSCGCIIYQMIYGKPPYGSYSGNQRVMAIMNPQVKIQFPSRGLGNSKVPTSAIELMQNCLKRNPSERWTVVECLQSDFLRPKVVSETFIRDLVHSAVNFGYNNRVNSNGLITSDVYDKLVDTVLKQIEDLNYG